LGGIYIHIAFVATPLMVDQIFLMHLLHFLAAQFGPFFPDPAFSAPTRRRGRFFFAFRATPAQQTYSRTVISPGWLYQHSAGPAACLEETVDRKTLPRRCVGGLDGLRRARVGGRSASLLL